MTHIYFMIGIPGSGKSTFALKLRDKLGIKHYICPDEIREYLTGSADDFSQEGNVWNLVHMKLAHAARTKQAAILDATGANPHLRRKMCAYLKNLDCKIWGMYKKVPLDIALYRNSLRDRVVPDHVIERMYKSLIEMPPTRFDGFDDIVEVF